MLELSEIEKLIDALELELVLSDAVALIVPEEDMLTD